MSIFIQRGLKPNVVNRTAQSEVMRGMVARGHGYALANVRPRNKVTLSGAALAYVPLEGDTAALTMGIAMLDGLRLSRMVTTFVDYCRETIRTGEIPGMDFGS
jgi:DNA-binding transcriptional LysR family regulator